MSALGYDGCFIVFLAGADIKAMEQHKSVDEAIRKDLLGLFDEIKNIKLEKKRKILVNCFYFGQLRLGNRLLHQ